MTAIITISVFDDYQNLPMHNAAIYLEKIGYNNTFVLLSKSFTDLKGNCINLVRNGYTLTEGVCRINFDLSYAFSPYDSRRLSFSFVSVYFNACPETVFDITLRLNEKGYTVQIP